MNWLARARREIGGMPSATTANSADGNPTAVMAVLHHAPPDRQDDSNGGIGSALLGEIHDSDLQQALEERAAIMEFEGGMTCDDAERAAWALIAKPRGCTQDRDLDSTS